MWLTPSPLQTYASTIRHCSMVWQCSQNALLIDLIITTCSSKQGQNQQRVQVKPHPGSQTYIGLLMLSHNYILWHKLSKTAPSGLFPSVLRRLFGYGMIALRITLHMVSWSLLSSSSSSSSFLLLLLCLFRSLAPPCSLLRHISTWLRPLQSLDRWNLFVPWARTTMAKSRSFTVISHSLWNRLPPTSRNTILSSFSLLSKSLALLKTCLFSRS